jgi:DNA-binding MarR family transcriptional regulator
MWNCSTKDVTSEGVQQLSSMMQQQEIDWRRNQVFQLSSKDHNQSEIARALQVDKSIVTRDVGHLK